MKKIAILFLFLFASSAFAADQYIMNPFTGELDNQGATDTSGDLNWLKLDQTTPQTTVGTFTFPSLVVDDPSTTAKITYGFGQTLGTATWYPTITPVSSYFTGTENAFTMMGKNYYLGTASTLPGITFVDYTNPTTTRSGFYLDTDGWTYFFGDVVGTGLNLSGAPITTTGTLGAGAITGTSVTTGLTTGLGVYTTTGGLLTTTAPSSGILGYWTRTGTTLSQATANDALSLGSGTILTTGTLGAGAITGTIGRFTTGIYDNAATPKLLLDTTNRRLYDSAGTIVQAYFKNEYTIGLAGSIEPAAASKSLFMGKNAGFGAASVFNSIFFGDSAGSSAGAAEYSNFLGYQAGTAALAAKHSNFFGFGAGTAGVSAEYSNFFGYQAGNVATAAKYSNFFGPDAGNSASSAYSSIFIGKSAGKTATYASNAIFLGENSGLIDTVINNPTGTINSGSLYSGGTTGYNTGDVLTVAVGNADATFSVDAITNGGVSSTTVYNGGTQYAEDDRITIENGGTPCELNVETVDGGGGLLTVSVVTEGTNFNSSTTYPATSLTGSGFAGEITVDSIINGAVSAVTKTSSGTGGYYVGFPFATTVAPAGGTGATISIASITQLVGNSTSIAIGRYSGTGGYANSIALGRGVKNSATLQANFGNVLYLSNIYNSDTPSATPTTTGSLGVGIVPTARLTLPAGAAGAGLAPIKFTDGPLTTTAVAAQMEYLITSTVGDLYFTPESTNRNKIVMTSGVTSLTATKVPYATTNGRLIDSSFYSDGADNYWVGAGTGLPYGEISGHNAAVDVVLTTLAQDYQVLAFTANGVSNLTTPDHTEDHITITKTGVYKVFFSCSARGAAAVDISVSIKKNNGATAFDNCDIHYDIIAGGKDISSSGSCLLSLTANDTIELWMHRNDGAAAKTVTVDHCTLNVTMIGG